ncbi:MAG: DUF1569 domain-containing protein [Chitinophagaceae bacterium]|nr:DUF1569 domain-containing protein [Chitinophagaceae bacterium]
MQNIFSTEGVHHFTERIQRLNNNTQAQWGKMNVAQMLAHCNVTYRMIYEPGFLQKPGFLKGLLFKWFIKPYVVSEKPYKQSVQTAPQFIVVDEKNFNEERQKLLSYMQRVQQEGEIAFEGRESHSFGPLTAKEWNTLFAKHLDHHLRQFGA